MDFRNLRAVLARRCDGAFDRRVRRLPRALLSEQAWTACRRRSRAFARCRRRPRTTTRRSTCCTSGAKLTRARGLGRVRAGYAYQPPALCTYRRRRAACPQGPTYCTGYAYPPRPYRTYSVLWQPRPALRAILEPRGYRYERANEHLVEGSTHTPNYDDPNPNYDDPTPNYDDASQVRAADLGRRGLRAQDALPTSRTTGKGRARRRTPRTRRQLRCQPQRGRCPRRTSALAVEGRAKHSHRRNQRLMHQRPLSTYLPAYLVRATVQL